MRHLTFIGDTDVIGANNRTIEDRFLYYALIVCFCANALGRGSIFCMILSVLAVVAFKLEFHVDVNTVIMLVFAIAVAIVSIVFYTAGDTFKAFNYFMMYVLGYNGYICAKNKGRFIKRTLFAIFLGFDLHLMLTYIVNFGRERIKVRTLYDVWTNELISVTLIGLLSCMIIGYSFYALFCNKNIKLKIFSIISIIIMLLINIGTATRTPILLFAIVYSVTFLIYALNKHDDRLLKAFGFCCAAALLVVVAYSFNWFDLRHSLMNNPLVSRFRSEGLETNRWKIDKVYFRYMPEYLWGGSHIYGTVHKMAHNFLQECYDMYGIVAFAALLLVLIEFVGIYVKLIFKPVKRDVDILFAAMGLSVLLQLFLEPVFRGYPPLIFSMLLIFGIEKAYLSDRAYCEEKTK